MKQFEQDNPVFWKGRHILERLSEAIREIHSLESLSEDHRDAVIHCEQTLESVAVDIACISTDGGEWDQMSAMIREAGIEIPEDLDRDMRQLFAGDDSCLE